MKKFKKAPKRQSSDRKDEKKKGIGLFDHVKQITQVQNPDYFKNLSDEDKKSFNHFMILRAISMNPERLDDVALLFRYFSTIPSPALYKLLITLLPPDRRYHPWIKAKKQCGFNQEVYDYIMRKFECSPKEAKEYANILNRTQEGKDELFNVCRGFGLENRQVEKLLNQDDGVI
jgi:hypothetical protein